MHQSLRRRSQSVISSQRWLLPCLVAILIDPALADHAGNPSLALIDVNVISMTDANVSAHQTLLIDDGHITAIGPMSTTPVPEGTLAIRAGGGYLIPGLAEMHAHIPAPDSLQLNDVLSLYLTRGITTVRGMLGQPAHLALRAQAADNQIFAPNIYTSGPSFNGNSVSSPAHAGQMVREQKKAGYDLLKLHPGLSRGEFDTIVRVANEVNMPFAGHVSVEVGLDRALAAHQNSVDHLDDYVRALVPPGAAILESQPAFFGINMATHADLKSMPALAARTAAAGVWVVPTETLMVNLAGPASVEELSARPEMRYISAATLAQWQRAKHQFQSQSDVQSRQAFLEVRRLMLKALHDAQAGILLGSDAPQIFNVPGFSLHRELELMVQAGLTPYQALRTGTVNVATYFGLTNAGEIKAGYRADLVLLADNPLEEITRTADIRGVVIRGAWHDATSLQSRLDAIEDKHSQ